MDISNEVLKTGALILCPVLVGILALFVRTTVTKVLAKIESLDRTQLLMGKDIEMLSKELKSVAHVGTEWAVMKHDVTQIAGDVKNLKSVVEDVVILKRDQKTIWKRIDELREDVREGKAT